MTAQAHSLPPNDQMGALLRETFRAMIECVSHQFDETGLPLSQWLTLKLVAAGTIQCISDVNRELGTVSGASTRIVDKLESRGLARRERQKDDRRIVRLAVTEEGERLLSGMQPRIQEFWADRMAIFSTSEQGQLFDLLSRLRNELADQAEVNTKRKRRR